MISRFFSIASNAFLETIRQPVFGVILFATTLMLILNVGLSAFTLENDNKLLIDVGLSTLLLSGLFSAVFCASGVLTREIDNKTVLTIISKPVSRATLITGKFAGLGTALALSFYLCFLVFLMTMRHKVLQNSTDPWDQPVFAFGLGALMLGLSAAALLNFFHGREFASTSLMLVTPLMTLAVVLIGFWDAEWTPQPFGTGIFDADFFIGGFLVFLAVMVVSAVAMAASTRLSQMMTLLVCVLVTAIGLVSDYALGQYAGDSAIFGAAYRIMPNLGVFWLVDAINADVYIPPFYVLLVLIYSLLLIAAALLIGIACFQRREVG